MDKSLLKSKFLGAFIGTAVGDSLGAGFEGWRQVSIEGIKTAVAGRRLLTYTDDTQMMIGVAQSLVRVGGFDGKDMAQTFIRNYELEPYRGYGPGPPRIFRLIRDGAAWDEVAQTLYPGGSYGNGSAMRIAPVGVLYHDNPDDLRNVASQSSRITHAHPLGKEGAALQACAVALATTLDPEDAFKQDVFLSSLTGFAREKVYREKLNSVGNLLPASDKARVIIELGHGIEAFNSVPTAIYSFLANPGSFADAVLYAVSLGGDTDTIAAMTGAISGAYLGIEAIPAHWQAKLENKRYIAELAEKLWHLRVSNRATP